MRLGIADHFGWAVAVTASADHEVVDRRRIELVEPGVTEAPGRLHHVPQDPRGARPRPRLERPPLPGEGRHRSGGQDAGEQGGRGPPRPSGNVGASLDEGPSDGARCDDRGRLIEEPVTAQAFPAFRYRRCTGRPGRWRSPRWRTWRRSGGSPHPAASGRPAPPHIRRSRRTGALCRCH